MNDVGFSISEGVANGATPYKKPSKRNIGLLGQFVRGVEFSPQKITRPSDFNEIFGGQSSSYFGPGIVKSIFDEAGDAPVTMYVARVIGSGSTEAHATHGSVFGGVEAEINAAYKGVPDKGSWGNAIKVQFYSKDSLVRGMFTVIVKYKDAKETYNYPTVSELQTAINKVSKYISVEFTGNATESYEELGGTVIVTAGSKIVKAGTCQIDTLVRDGSLRVGTALYTPEHALIGTISGFSGSAQDMVIILSTNPLVTGTIDAMYRVDSFVEVSLSGGKDGDVKEEDFYPVADVMSPKGLACFDGADVQIIACTEFHSLSMAKVLNDYLASKRNPIGVVNLPLNADEGTAELYADALQTNGHSFVASYMGWTTVPTEQGNSMLIPAIGPILGSAYIRTPYLQGNGVHIPPGGETSVFKNVLQVIPANISQDSVNKLVQQLSCNVIRHDETVGYYVGSSRTYSTNELYMSIHIRMQTSYYLRALKSLLIFMEQKPNTPELKRSALVELNSYFKSEYDAGALERSVDFGVAYKGICDKSNNPTNQDRKLINIDVLYIPTECTESVHLSLMRNDGVLTITEE